ncbi:hypothetical protein PENTCL1PPCAC_8952, partial [Pristionchus entomophagus]
MQHAEMDDNSEGFTLRSKIFDFLEKSLSSSLTLGESTDLVLFIRELCTTYDFESYLITTDNLSEREQAIVSAGMLHRRFSFSPSPIGLSLADAKILFD